MNENAISESVAIIEEEIDRPRSVDADESGHLAMGLFVGVILVLLVVIYAFASAA